DPAFHDVLQLHAAQNAWAIGDDEWCGTGLRDRIHGAADLLRYRATEPFHVRFDRVGRALTYLTAVHVHAAHTRLRGERHERRAELLDVPLANAVLLLGEHDDASAFGSLVGERGELSGIGEVALGNARRRDELCRLPISQRDRAGLVEQQHVHV